MPKDCANKKNYQFCPSPATDNGLPLPARSKHGNNKLKTSERWERKLQKFQG
jgi:hypothetical protein